MAHESKHYRAGRYSALLGSTALAMALLVQASPARSETLDLACASTGEGPSFNIRLLIDTDRKTLTEVGMGAFGEFNSPAYAATISEQFIKYEGQGAGNSDFYQEGTLDRIAGTYTRTKTEKTSNTSSTARLSCRRATQKF